MGLNPRAPEAALAIVVALLLAPILSVAPAAPVPGRTVAVPVGLAPASSVGVSPLAASFSFALTASAARADPTDPVPFTVYFNNTGTQPAPEAWINVTAANGFTFASDTASGNVSGYPDYVFSNVPLGLHSFTLTFVVNVGVAPGSRLAVSATLVYANGAGGQQFQGPASASVLVGVVAEPLYLGWNSLLAGALSPVAPTGSLQAQGTFTLTAAGPAVNFDLASPLARPFQALNATAILYVQPLLSPATLDVNLTLLDVSGGVTTRVATVEQAYTVTGSGYWTLFYTFPATNYRFAAGDQIRLQVLNTAASTESATLATNATAEPSRVSFQTTTYVTVDALQPSLSPATYLSPKSSLVVTANVSDPLGSAQIVDARLNLTGPSGPIVTWQSLLPAVAVDPSSPSAWKLFRYTLSSPLLLGTYTVRVTAVERSGATDIAAGGAIVREPSFTLQKGANTVQAKTGTKVTYTIWYNNTGSGPAGRVWINDTLPSQETYFSSTPTATGSGSTWSWSFSNVAPGPYSVQMVAQVKSTPGVSYIRNWAFLNDSDPQGFPGPFLASHADVVINGPILALSQSSVPAGAVHSNQTVVFTIGLMNSGDAAQTIWLNDTLPSGLAYVSDTATVRPTVAGGQVRWTFPGMPAGTSAPAYLNFTMTARAAAALPEGASLPNTIRVNDTSLNGLLMPEQISVLPLTLASPVIPAASASFGARFAVPNVPLPLYVNFTNGGNEPAATTWINLTLGPSLSFVSAAVPATATGAQVELVLPNASVGADSVLVTVAAAPAVADGDALTVSGSLRPTDGFGNLLGAVPVPTATVLVALPDVSFRLSPANVTAEAGTSVTFTLTGGNSGTGTASAVWLNLTLPAGLAYVNDTFGAVRTPLASGFSWSWSGYEPGPRTYALVLGVQGTAADRSTATFSVSVQALDAGGNPRPASGAGGRVSVLAPSFALDVWADSNRTDAGSTLTYTLVAENVGSTPAQTVWLTDTFDPQLSVLYYSANVSAAGTGTATLNWTFENVAPGQILVIRVVVKVADGVPGNTRIFDSFGVRYTNSAGTVLASTQSPPSSVVVSPNVLGLVLFLAASSGLGALVVLFVYRRYRVRIEDVFLIYRDGILVSHLVQGDGLDKDEDQLSGMLTAVQDFVKDAFTYGEHRELHQLEFGDYHVLIERGKVVYLAVVYQGRDSGLIRKKVRSVLDRVETAYGGVFDRWDGDMARVEGTQALLREGFVETKRPWSLVKSGSV